MKPIDIDFTKNRHMLICGATRSGKSYFGGFVTEQMIAQGRVCVVLDPKNENLDGLNELKNVVGIRISDNDIKRHDKITNEIVKYLEKGVSVVVNPEKDLADDDFKNFEEEIAEKVFLLPKNLKITIVLDECRRHLLEHQQTPIFMQIVTRGLGDNKNMVMITQRLNRMSSDVLSECHRIVVFNLNRSLDIDYLGKESDNFARALKDLKTMPAYHSIFWDLETDNVYKLKPVSRSTKHNG